jgi:hypothetical protein
MKDLARLNLGLNHQISSLQPLESCTKLSKLYISGGDFVAVGVPGLEHLRGLSGLTISTQLTKEFES